MRAYLIDTPNKQIVEVDYNGDYRTIKEHIRADLFTAVMLEGGDCLFVDDEGLINDNPHGWIKLEGYTQPLRGYGLVLGTDKEGESIEPSATLEELRGMIAFPSDEELDHPESYARSEVISFNSPEAMLEALFGPRT